jgi:hypothetical protein
LDSQGPCVTSHPTTIVVTPASYATTSTATPAVTPAATSTSAATPATVTPQVSRPTQPVPTTLPVTGAGSVLGIAGAVSFLAYLGSYTRYLLLKK